MQLRNNLYNIALIYINKFHPNNFNDFILSEKLNVWHLISTLQKCINQLDISAQQFHNLAKSLTEKYYNDMSISMLYNTVRSYCQINIEKGYELLDMCINFTSFPLNNILIRCMTGLLYKD